MAVQLVKKYLYLIFAIGSSKNNFQHNQLSDYNCLYEHEPELGLKYFMHKRNDNENIEDRTRIDALKEMCGDLCQTFDPEIPNANNKVHFKTKGNGYKLFEPPSKHVSCDVIWSNPMLESHDNPCSPPRIISDHLEREFSYNYTIKLEYAYYDDSPRMKNNGDAIQVTT